MPTSVRHFSRSNAILRAAEFFNMESLKAQRRPREARGWHLVRTLVAVCMLCTGVASEAAQRPDSRTPAESRLDLARQQELDLLHHRVGRFATGEASVFTGQVEVTLRQAGRITHRLPMGRVVAALAETESHSSSGTDARLTVVSNLHSLWFQLTQLASQPDTTQVTQLRPIHASAGVTGACRWCLADLRQRPETIVLDGLEAAGRLRDAGRTKFQVTFFGRLEQVAVADMKLADLEILNPGPDAILRGEVGGFEHYGGEGIWRVERQIRQLVAPAPGAPPQTRCERATNYAAERFVDLADLTRSGVRNLKFLDSQICCLDQDSHGKAEDCVPEEAR